MLFDYIFGASSGLISLLSRTIRDELGLVYDIYSSITDSADIIPGYFSITFSTSPQQSKTAIEKIQNLINEFLRKGPSLEEFIIARNSLLGSFILYLQTPLDFARRALFLENYDLPSDYFIKAYNEISKLTPDNLIKCVKKYINPDDFSYVIVGPKQL